MSWCIFSLYSLPIHNLMNGGEIQIQLFPDHFNCQLTTWTYKIPDFVLTLSWVLENERIALPGSSSIYSISSEISSNPRKNLDPWQITASVDPPKFGKSFNCKEPKFETKSDSKPLLQIDVIHFKNGLEKTVSQNKLIWKIKWF